MTKMTGVEYDPALSRILAIFAVGCFLNAGGHDLTQEQVDIIRGMLAEKQLPRPLRELDFADSFMGWGAAILSG